MKSVHATRSRCVTVLYLVVCLLLLPADALARCEIRPPPRALPAPGPNELVMATQNLWRLVDTRSDASADKPVTPEEFVRRIDDVAFHIRKILGSPHVLAVQEVENTAVLEQLADRIADQGGPRYRAFLLDGFDPSGIDVALLARDPVRVGAVTDLFRESRFNRYPLFSRPPLHVRITEPVMLELVVVHLRSGRGLDDKRRGKNVREKRRRQARVLSEWLESRIARGAPVAVLGDLNSAEGEEPYGEPLAILVNGNVSEAWDMLPEEERFSYVWRCKPQAIDNILISPALRDRVTRGAVSRGNAGHQHRLYRGTAERRVSDHDGVAIYLSTAADEAPASCPASTSRSAQKVQGPEGPC